MNESSTQSMPVFTSNKEMRPSLVCIAQIDAIHGLDVRFARTKDSTQSAVRAVLSYYYTLMVHPMFTQNIVPPTCTCAPTPHFAPELSQP
jgi:hypothetical protein